MPPKGSEFMPNLLVRPYWPDYSAEWRLSSLSASPQVIGRPLQPADRRSNLRWAPPVQILASSSRASSGHLSALGGHRSARSTRPLPHGFGLHGCSMPTRLCSPRPAPLAPLLRGLDACCSLSTGQRSRRPLPNPALKRTASGGRLAPRWAPPVQEVWFPPVARRLVTSARSADTARRVLAGLCLTDSVYTAAQCRAASVRDGPWSWLRCRAFPQAAAHSARWLVPTGHCPTLRSSGPPPAAA